MNPYMEKANKEAEKGMHLNDGGPFGAVITDKKGNIISIAHNTVLKEKDPTAHAEINAIRMACKKLNTYDLSDYILYTSCEPCPMCFSAIVWANIKDVYYACNRKDAASIGFRDDAIYSYLAGENKDLLHLHPIDRENCISLFQTYQEEGGEIY